MSHPLRIPFGTSGRANSFSPRYFRMCGRSLVKYRQLARKLATLDLLDVDYDDTAEQTEESGIAAVVFGAMCLESTLYDLGACLFGDSYADHTDKLGPMGKFVVIAKYMDREVPDESQVPFQKIKALVTARNQLVHSKSLPTQEFDFQRIAASAQRQHKQLVQGINASFSALVHLSLYFDGNIFEDLRIIPSFKKQEYWVNAVPTALHEDVRKCIHQAASLSGINGASQSAP